jgi:hypothetical protein
MVAAEVTVFWTIFQSCHGEVVSISLIGDECDGTEMDLSWIVVAKMALMGVVVVVVWVVSVVWW